MSLWSIVYALITTYIVVISVPDRGRLGLSDKVLKEKTWQKGLDLQCICLMRALLISGQSKRAPISILHVIFYPSTLLFSIAKTILYYWNSTSDATHIFHNIYCIIFTSNVPLSRLFHFQTVIASYILIDARAASKDVAIFLSV